MEKVENQLIKIIKLAKTPWMPWKVFRDEACKKFFRGEDRNRVEAEVFMRRISQVLHKDMKVRAWNKDYKYKPAPEKGPDAIRK